MIIINELCYGRAQCRYTNTIVWIVLKLLRKLSLIQGTKRFYALIARVKIMFVFFRPFLQGAEGSRTFPHPPTVVLPAAGFPEPIDQEPWVLKRII
jgi:hypothetical protein